MHFRVRKNVIQLIRTTYDPTRKKGVGVVVGTVRLAAPGLSNELRAQLSTEELAEFESWIGVRHRADLLRDELAALSLVEAMAAAERWFEREGDSVVARGASAAIMRGWQLLRKRLAKGGLLD